MLAEEVHLFKHISFFVYCISNADHKATEIGQESADKASWSQLVGAQFSKEVFKLFLERVEARLDELVLETWRHLAEEWLSDECIIAGVLRRGFHSLNQVIAELVIKILSFWLLIAFLKIQLFVVVLPLLHLV